MTMERRAFAKNLQRHSGLNRMCWNSHIGLYQQICAIDHIVPEIKPGRIISGYTVGWFFCKHTQVPG
jgi:hypothetical protein